MIPVARLLGTAQTKWIERVEKRLSTTSSTLKDIKSFKMLGIIDVLGSAISSLRTLEISTSMRYRKLIIWEVALCKSNLVSLREIMNSSLTPYSKYCPDRTRPFCDLCSIYYPVNCPKESFIHGCSGFHVSGLNLTTNNALVDILSNYAKHVTSCGMSESHPGLFAQ